MRNVMLLEEEVAKDKAREMYGDVVSCAPTDNYNRIQGLRNRVDNLSRIVEDVDGRVHDNLRRIDDLNHKLCNTQRHVDSVQSQLHAHQRFVADMCGIAAIFMVLICILVGYLLWRTAWL